MFVGGTANSTKVLVSEDQIVGIVQPSSNEAPVVVLVSHLQRSSRRVLRTELALQHLPLRKYVLISGTSGMLVWSGHTAG